LEGAALAPDDWRIAGQQARGSDLRRAVRLREARHNLADPDCRVVGEANIEIV